MHPSKVLWFSMILCSVTVYIHRIRICYIVLKMKLHNKLGEQGIIHVWHFGVGIMRYCRVLNHGDGPGAIIPMTTREYSSKPYLLYSKKKTHKFPTYLLRLSMASAMLASRGEEISIIGGFGQQALSSKPTWLQLGHSTVNLVLNLFLYGKQWRTSHLQNKETMDPHILTHTKSITVDLTHWINITVLMGMKQKISNTKLIWVA